MHLFKEQAVKDVDAPDRDEWEWPEHGGSHARVPERPARHG